MPKFQHELTELITKAATYGELFKKNEDSERYDKIKLFGKKLTREEYMIGFAGHFSAGKSSMINALTGVDLLPSSPIPTSANIVKVKKSDTDYAVIHLMDGKGLKYEGHDFPNAIKTYSKDGSTVSLIEIGHKDSALPAGITVMDTPGVDSTDDAHRQSTESALHLADLVFYTMDYNHVQSELNFSFTKELMRHNPNVYLIINQIDKHRDSELSFEEFQHSVENSFKLWGVKPKGVFYTSLKVEDHPHNDFPEVKEIITGSMSNWKEFFIENANNTILQLQEEHKRFLKEKIAEEKELHASLVMENEWTNYDTILNELNQTKKALTLQSEEAFVDSFDKGLSALIENAAVTPYETRELLKSYLESLSPNFKVGFLFGAKKTAEERTRRKDAFRENIGKLIHTQIEVHVKTFIKKLLNESQLLTDDRSLEVDSLNLVIPFEEVEKHFNASDIMTGDTVINNANQMKTNIILAYRRLTEDLKLETSEFIRTNGNEKSDRFHKEIHSLEEKLEVIGHVEALNNLLETIDENVENPSSIIIEKRDKLIKTWHTDDILDITEFVEDETTENLFDQSSFIESENEVYQVQSSASEEVSSNALHVARVVENVPGFIDMAQYLRKKAKRLDEQEFTVALFGAFSAGKSSFSNALIGENILPVSPNPTTATINRICPVGPGKEDGTADVILKTLNRMTEDVLRSFDALGIPVETLDDAFAKTDNALNTKLTDDKLHIHKAFIEAFKQGYLTYRGQLGTVLKVGRDEFVKFVAEENRSCFVESIDFYYDCEITRKGITLVDTPGADSINARHTDVAFDYIRNADAVLFVTYYNHAFAKADREFLIQLGRVKDAFELDKMFFIVNAIDLASNDEEAELVQSFVGNELQKFGIRTPRVHGISSLQALQAKIEKQSNEMMDLFERDFHHFLEHDLRGLAVQSLEEETMKTTERLASLISRTEKNMKRKSERLIELANLEEIIQRKYASSFIEVFQTSTKNELNELVYYILQRVFLRFSDFFREAYNPSVFAAKSSSEALKIALDETVHMIGFDLTQELKVTNLRIVNFLTKQLTSRQRIEVQSLKEIDDVFEPTLFEPREADLLSFEFPFPDSAVYSSVNRLFRNDKSFFERGDRDKLKTSLEELLRIDTALYLDREKKRLEVWVAQLIEEEAEALRVHLLKECMIQIDSERTLLTETEKIDDWRNLYNSLEKELV
ncbi:dynamin family protein [Sporosarcina sp. Marseille-Q4063]|uniref:dynamin family protein n=1 Tax=Sporosarcina sp. Marseille-Q4063 TaxID=2810514 RepID=UPI001BB087C6|nr:dynamin family protein [Sporosarcina sp. Marseille-Q4063]QUW22150.1 dynamin family protein [Sporosarcina sp. Marseille-Q4063]